MNTNDLNTALYEKMAAEQDKFRDWLKSQPPEEILHHTYEYTVREDIVMAMEELELTDAQAKALLESPSPLAVPGCLPPPVRGDVKKRSKILNRLCEGKGKRTVKNVICVY